MKCKQLFENFRSNQSLEQPRTSTFRDVASPTHLKRPSAMKFLGHCYSKDELEDVSSNGSHEITAGLNNFRAHSPSPVRKRGSLLDLFSMPDNSEMALTHGLMEGSKKPPKLTARQIDETCEGDIPTTSYNELPPSFSEMSERRRVEETLLNERIDQCLALFYKEMNETAYKQGLKKSNFAVAHGMHHYNNWSSALDIAKLSRTALASHSMLLEIVNTK